MAIEKIDGGSFKSNPSEIVDLGSFLDGGVQLPIRPPLFVDDIPTKRIIGEEFIENGTGAGTQTDIGKFQLYLSRDTKNAVEEIIIDLIPQVLSYSYTPNFTAQSTLGRLSPIYLYSGGSEETYSFSLTLHEDEVIKYQKGKYKSLEEFVDKLKSLSYPYTDNEGFQVYNKVTLILGEISGKGILNTEVAWKKPLRNGKYILAEVTFTFTLESKFSPAITTTKKVLYEGGEYTILSSMAISYRDSDSYHERFDDIINTYGITTPNLLDISDKEYQDVIVSASTKAFNRAQEQLKDIRDSFIVLDSTKQINDELAFLVSFIDKDISKITKKDLELLKNKNAKEKIRKYVEDYYAKKLNTELVAGEIQLIIDSLENILDVLRTASQGVLEFGSNS